MAVQITLVLLELHLHIKMKQQQPKRFLVRKETIFCWRLKIWKRADYAEKYLGTFCWCSFCNTFIFSKNKCITKTAPANLPHHRRNDAQSSGRAMPNGTFGNITAHDTHIPPPACGKSCPVELKDARSGGVVKVASLKGLIKVEILTPGIFHSNMKETEKEDTDPFSRYQISTVAARRLQYNFPKRIDSFQLVDAKRAVSSPVSGSFVKKGADNEGRVERTCVTAGDRMCVYANTLIIITENSFNMSEA